MPEKDTEVETPSTEVSKETPTEQKEETLQDAFKKEPVEEKKSDAVPLSKYMDEKNDHKETKKLLSDATAAIIKLQNQGTQSIAPSDLKAIAEKYDMDPNALTELASVLESRARESAKQEIAPQLKELEQAQNADKFEKTFEKLWNGSLENNPEYADIANKDAIKQLSMLPQNQTLTLTQLLEQTYGQVVNKGRKTIEPSRPAGGKTGEAPNFTNPSPEEWKEIKESPELLKQYNEHLIKNLRL